MVVILFSALWLVVFVVGIASGLVSDFSFFGHKLNSVQWNDVQSAVNCWATNGSWVFNNKTIIDDIKLYRKCHKFIGYGPKNPCSWILDRDALRYDWLDTCPKPRTRIDPHKICQMMQGRDILFVGDSVQKLLYSSFFEELLLVANATCKHVDPIFEFPCQDAPSFKLKYARNDELSLGIMGRTEIVAEFSSEILEAWEHLIGENDVVVLNRGAHYHVDSELLDGVNTTLHYLRTNHPNVSVIYRNTLPGVQYKETIFAPPLKTKPIAKAHYHWDKFEGQNELVLNLINTHYPEVLHLDVFSPTVLREDAHYDHIHYCIPGPVSLWVDFLYNALMLIDKKA